MVFFCTVVYQSIGCCKYCIVGSEKAKTEGQTTAEQLVESNNINKSLLVLGKLSL